jgi:hypothetical protein
MVIGDEEDESGVDLDSFVSKDSKSWLHTQWQIEAKRPVVACGTAFHKPIVQDTATAIFGVFTKLSFAARATYSSGKGNRRNSSCGALE